MNEAGHQARAGKSSISLRALTRRGARTQGANVHSEFHDAQQRFQGKSFGKLRGIAWRNQECSGKGIAGSQWDDRRVVFPGKRFAGGLGVHRCEFGRQCFSCFGIATIGDNYALKSLLVRLENHHASRLSFLPDHSRQLSQ